MTTTDSSQTDTADIERLRDALMATLHRFNSIHSQRVEAAFRAVPRHLFLPDVDLATAYAAKVIVTKRGTDGSALSSASDPHVVASMLEQLDVQPGHRILEVGAGTGINAALLQELTGPTGHVTTVDIDDEVTEGARRGLAAAGYDKVAVLCADGADGHAAGAPWDRIIVTTGAWDIAPAWWEQLAAGGRLVVPLRLHGSDLTRSIAFDKHATTLISASAKVCGFVPMLGTAAHPGHSIALTDDVTLRLPADGSNIDSLSRALAYPAHQRWTGVMVSDDQPIEHLDLWLVTQALGFARLFPSKQARQNGIDPARRWAGASVYDGGTLAYITRRDDGKGELGVNAYGPDGERLAGQLIHHLHAWDRQRPAQPKITGHPVGTPDVQLTPGHLIDKPSARITISW